jgi:hypothetical protein
MAYSRAGEADAAIAAIKQTIARTKTLT